MLPPNSHTYATPHPSIAITIIPGSYYSSVLHLYNFDILIVTILSKWNNTVCSLLKLAFSTQCNTLKIHQVPYMNSFFFFIVEYYSLVQICTSLFNYLPIDGQLNCLQFSAIINKNFHEHFHTCFCVLICIEFPWIYTQQ